MAAALDEFEPWLINKLKSLKTDEGVFSSYISGILDSEESVDDKKDALEGILAEIVESDISIHVNEIIEKWESSRPKEEDPKPCADVDVQLAKLIESQSLATTTRREYTDEKKIREAILSQYSQLSDNEEDEVKEEEPESLDIVKNTNAADVAAAARERREQARQDAQRKKEKDKEDREKQKQLKEDKKEKRKTQKGERKR
ncbi:LOW QUALITY PROTEIN: coiled-coil domain-containing protein 43 [Aphomia sociella]